MRDDFRRALHTPTPFPPGVGAGSRGAREDLGPQRYLASFQHRLGEVVREVHPGCSLVERVRPDGVYELEAFTGGERGGGGVRGGGCLFQ